MFTGIIEDLGVVRRVRDEGPVRGILVRSRSIAKELRKGDSVSINGVCMTATRVRRRSFWIQAMQETLDLTTLASLRSGDEVNLELPVRIIDRLGGHLVQGHVDGIAEVDRIDEGEGGYRVWLGAESDVLRFLVPKGSVCLDGVSLTVVEVGDSTFQVALIPHTLMTTTLGGWSEGSEVNVEVDVLAKYVQRLTPPAHVPARTPARLDAREDESAARTPSKRMVAEAAVPETVVDTDREPAPGSPAAATEMRAHAESQTPARRASPKRATRKKRHKATNQGSVAASKRASKTKDPGGDAPSDKDASPTAEQKG